MKYQRLKELKNKEKFFERLMFIVFIPVVLLVLFVMRLASNNVINPLWITIIIVIGIPFVVFGVIFMAKNERYSSLKADCITDEVLNLIEEFGIPSGSYELIDCKECYKVAFHNIIIEYDVLQAKIDEELNNMNKIADTKIIVKLV